MSITGNLPTNTVNNTGRDTLDSSLQIFRIIDNGSADPFNTRGNAFSLGVLENKKYEINGFLTVTIRSNQSGINGIILRLTSPSLADITLATIRSSINASSFTGVMTIPLPIYNAFVVPTSYNAIVGVVSGVQTRVALDAGINNFIALKRLNDDVEIL